MTIHSMAKRMPDNVKKRRLRSLIGFYLPPILPFVFFLAAWWVICLFDIPKYILPSPGQVLDELFNSKWRWFPQIWTTTQEVMGGFVLAVMVGVLLGLVVSWNETLSRTLMPILLFFNSMPKVAAAPLVLVWFGFGVLPNIIMSFVISFFPVLLNTARGVSEVPYEMTELALTFNTPKWKRFAMIRVPYALPYIMTGVKLASIMAVTGAIVGEFIASEKGLAALILQAQSYLEMGAMVGALLWISVMAMILFGLINLAEKLLMPWAKIRQTD
ncbi:MAG: transporter permease [Deltaproteobacteria bacterium]|nr:transporter permease [Deltaproteobacteria bacterium]